jgi:DNA-binding MarR family transcriptional regulator
MPMTDDLDELAAAFVTASRALLGIAIRSVQAAPVAVTVPQHRVLVLLDADGTQSVGAIAQQLGVNPSNATRVCDRLQRLELIERARSTRDGRAVEISITEAGRAVVDAVTAYRTAEVSRLLGDMPPDLATAALAAMREFNRAAHEQSVSDRTVARG